VTRLRAESVAYLLSASGAKGHGLAIPRAESAIKRLMHSSKQHPRLLDDLVSASEQRGREREPECLGGL
jgi:hypothetical protein